MSELHRLPPGARVRGQHPRPAGSSRRPGTIFGFLALLALVATLAAVPATAAADVTVEGDLPRRADLGFSVGVDDGSLVVRAVEDGSAANDVGLRTGDRIVSVDGQPFDRPYVGQDLLRRLLGDRPARLEIERDGDRREIGFTPPPRPFEAIEGVDSHYGVVEAPDGSRLRTIVTRPADARGPLPAIFFVQWVSCGSIEVGPDGGPAREILAALAERSGMSLIRVERTASGDSEGPGCHELDYDTELAHYRYAFDELVADPGIDAETVFVYGSSLGATMAPLLVQEVLADDAEMAAVRDDVLGLGDGVHYGRPHAWHQQAARRNFLGAWADVTAPVLVVFNEFDQYESRHGHELIAATVNRLRAGTATYVEQPRTGHSNRLYPSIEEVYAGRNGVPVPETIVHVMLEWLRSVR